MTAAGLHTAAICTALTKVSDNLHEDVTPDGNAAN